MKTVDLHGLKAVYLSTHFPPLPSRGGKALHIRALTMSPQHRGLGIASRLLKLIKNKASKDRMLWIQLHVEEIEDISHELLLSIYRQHGFIVGANASCTALEREDFDWRQFSVQERCFLDVGEYLLINEGDGQINYEKFVYDCIFEESLLTRERARVREMEIGTPATGKVTWTGLPKIERTHWAAHRVQKGRWWVKDLDDLDRERGNVTTAYTHGAA